LRNMNINFMFSNKNFFNKQSVISIQLTNIMWFWIPLSIWSYVKNERNKSTSKCGKKKSKNSNLKTKLHTSSKCLLYIWFKITTPRNFHVILNGNKCICHWRYGIPLPLLFVVYLSKKASHLSIVYTSNVGYFYLPKSSYTKVDPSPSNIWSLQWEKMDVIKVSKDTSM